MGLREVLIASLLAVTLAQPVFAQGLDVRSGAPVRIEIVHVEATVEEGVAKVEVDETFRNTTGAMQEGVWRFKLPEDAVIGSFSMWMEGKEKHGRVLESVQARAVYDAIVRKKKDPGLLEQIGWREFRVNVFPIPARDTVRVKLVYAHVVRDDLGLETLEIPLPQEGGAVGDLRVHAMVTTARGLAGLDCPSHRDATLEVEATRAQASWNGDGVVPTGPFVLRAIPRPREADGQRKPGLDVTLLAQRPAGADSGYFVARVVPNLVAPPPIARDLLFVIDRSGSMQGEKIEQARAALLAGLDTLKPGDRFDVVSFASDVTALGESGLLSATLENLARGRRFARDLSASGGTNLHLALTTALARIEADRNRFCAIVFLTDGDPTVGEVNPDRILASWREKCGATRLFAFGVGKDVKDFLLTKLAVEGRGDARYVREGESLEVPLAALFERVRTPLLLDPIFEIEGDGVQVTDREPRRLPDLFQGRPLLISGRFKGSGRASLHLYGRSGASDVALTVPVAFPPATPERPHVAQIWAKSRVERLLDDLRVMGPNAELRQEILALGLAHQLVTPCTSFLVVEDGTRLASAADPLPGDPLSGDPPPEVIDRDMVPVLPDQAGGIVNPDANYVADAATDPTLDPGTFDPDPEALDNLPSGATGGTPIGVGSVGHYGTGTPAAFSSRRAGGSGKGGGGLGQGGGGGRGATNRTESAVESALVWLMKHQSPDGHWDPDGFEAQCKGDHCGGAGKTGHEVAATGLALLAFLGNGDTHQSGPFRNPVKNGLKFLLSVQDAEGCFAPRDAPDFLRQHALAALAMTEAFGMTQSKPFREPAQHALEFALQAKAPRSGWMIKDGGLDVETTAWMVLLCKSGAIAGLGADPQALSDAAAAFDALTDPATGRIVAPMRTDGSAVSDQMATAIGLLVRMFAGHGPDHDALQGKGADLLLAELPDWNHVAGPVDFTFWHFGSMAMFQLGGTRWSQWNDALKTAIAGHEQRDQGRDDFGSWDPVGRDSAQLGRIGATALNGLTLEVYYRYPREFSARTR